MIPGLCAKGSQLQYTVKKIGCYINHKSYNHLTDSNQYSILTVYCIIKVNRGDAAVQKLYYLKKKKKKKNFLGSSCAVTVSYVINVLVVVCIPSS